MSIYHYPNSRPAQSANGHSDHESGAHPRQLSPIVEFGRTPVFSEKLPTPPFVTAEFGTRPIHRATADGRWNINQLAEDHREKLVNSDWYRTSLEPLAPGCWSEILIRLGPCEFVELFRSSLMVYAHTADRAHQLLARYAGRYPLSSSEGRIEFELLQGGFMVTTLRVTAPVPALDGGALDRNYGSGFATWHGDLLRELRGARRGLVLLHGPSGTGKTTYLRKLMGDLATTHRFYAVSQSLSSLVTNSDLVGFWANQRYRHQALRLAILLEDCDSTLLWRENDNSAEVSALLGLTDGVLGDFLEMQVFCTVNCKLQEVDSAILRPGRLISERHFDRMPKQQAVDVARQLGRDLHPAEDYSLAEIYGGPDLGNAIANRKVGFASGR